MADEKNMPEVDRAARYALAMIELLAEEPNGAVVMTTLTTVVAHELHRWKMTVKQFFGSLLARVLHRTEFLRAGRAVRRAKGKPS